MDLGRVGIWSGQLRRATPTDIRDSAAELDELGFGAIWIPGGHGGDVFGDAGRLLDATTRATVATGILNVWMHTPEETTTGHAALTGRHPGRFLLGLGVSHEPAVTNSGQIYERPLTKMRDYLDALDAASPAVLPGERMLAALGPRMLELARDRTAGAHPYLVTPDHTAAARAVLGTGPLLATEVMVVLDADAERARAVARQHLGGTWCCRTTRTTSSVTASAKTTCSTVAAIVSSTASSRGATSTPSRRGSASTTMRAPTTCASRSCKPTRPPSPARPGAASPPPFSDLVAPPAQPA